MISKYFVNHHREQSFSKREIWFLLWITVVGMIIRIIYNFNRPFVGDEVGTLMYMEKSISYLLSHFEGWLTQNYFILLEKFMAKLGGHNQVSLCLVPLIAGIVTIPLTAVLARRLTSTQVSLISATLVAMNPYLISFGGVIRSYSLLTLLSLIVVILFLRWYTNRTFKNGIYVSLACYFLMLSHLNGAYTICYVLLIVCVDMLSSIKKLHGLKVITLLLPLSISILFIAVSYFKIYPCISTWGIAWHDNAPTSVAYLPSLVSLYFADGYYGWMSTILLISAFFVTYKYDTPLLVLLPYIILPIILISVQGVSHFPWAYARFLIFLVPVCIIFISEGILFYASLGVRRINILCFTLVILLLITWIPNLQNILNKRFDSPWHQIGNFIKTTYQKNDVILYSTGTYPKYILQLMYQYLPKSQYSQLLLTEYSEEEHNNDGSGNIFLVAYNPFFTSDYPKYTFGKLQVIIYPQETYIQSLLNIRDDHLKSIKPGEISSELTDHYRNIWELSKKLHQEDNNFKYYQLYMLCLRLTERQQNIPRSLQYWESEKIAKSIFSENSY